MRRKALSDGPVRVALVAKLYFRYGTMDSAKTLQLLAVAHNYRKQGKNVLLVKPRIDTRFGPTTIASRSGLSAEADLVVDEGTRLRPADFAGVDCLLVDEAQFLSPDVVVDLRRITVDPGVPVICYGLRTDFRTRLFPGAARLMELADRIEEVKVTCQYCGSKATCNLRLVDGLAAVDGPTVLLGADEQYVPVCWRHYEAALAEGASRGRGGRPGDQVEQAGVTAQRTGNRQQATGNRQWAEPDSETTNPGGPTF